jgi:Replication-relaxation
MNQNVARRPRFKRVSNFPNVRLTDRDRAILSVVEHYRFLTTSQILSLMPGSRQNIMRRLHRLYHGGSLDRPHAQLPLRFAGEIAELVYAPRKTVSGKQWKRVSSLFLPHALAVSDAVISIEAACRTHGLRFVTEQEILESTSDGADAKHLQWQVTIKDGKASERVAVIPDATFAIEHDTTMGSRRFFYFLEVDRGTMPLHRKSLRLSSIYRKALTYRETRRKRILKDRHDIPGFQVLFVSAKETRLKQIGRECCETGNTSDPSTFLFASCQELKASDALPRLGMV